MPATCLRSIPVLLATAALGACAGVPARPPRAAAVVPAEPAPPGSRAQDLLAAGRFSAAADHFADARAGGDDAPRTLLGHALALAGSWRQAEAAQLLLADGATLPVGDRALALALAGEPEIAVRLLVLAVEENPDNAALRQNLAFAFAMAGRWAEARAMAALDVPPAELPARLEKWAGIASAGATPRRLALMLDIAPPVPRSQRALAFRRPHWAGARW